jgi:hypothetical protein
MIQINVNVSGVPTDTPELKVDTLDLVTRATFSDDKRRASFILPASTPPHGATVRWANKTARTVIPATPGSYEGSSLTPPLPTLNYGSELQVDGDHFMRGSARFYVRGSTDFRLTERILRGVDIAPLLQDRRDAGANWLRLLSMKANNTGWTLDPKEHGYFDAVRKTFEILAQFQFIGEWCVFADTKALMPSAAQQREHYERTCGLVREYPHIVLELLNEDKHSTQAINAQGFKQPEGIVSSHGSGLSDVQPVKPFWNYATYHSRRSGGVAKITSNYNPYVFQNAYPTVVPFVPEETITPAVYGHDPRIARQFGLNAKCGTGGTFHHNAWNEARPFTDVERLCARAFYEALED